MFLSHKMIDVISLLHGYEQLVISFWAYHGVSHDEGGGGGGGRSDDGVCAAQMCVTGL